MKTFNSSARIINTALRLALACLLLAAQFVAFAQQPNQAQQPQSTSPTQPDDTQEDVLRVSTSVVQTDVSVVDKKGQFVEGLQREQFELKVDGKPQPVLFFERITAGSFSEAARIAAARGETASVSSAVAREYGRAVIFFIDDFHLSPEGINRAKELLRNFVEKEMTPSMQVLVASPGGQIGFLQQFTNDRAVVRAAIGRLKFLPQALLDIERPIMTPFQAEAIDRGDRAMLAYVVEQTLSETGQPPSAAQSVAMQAQQRARRIRRQAAQLNAGVVNALESVVRARSPLGGRQTLFYISEGFNRDSTESDLNAKLQRVTDAAARTGTVINSLFAPGLAVGMFDASSPARADINYGSGMGAYSPVAELSANQGILRDLAADTGGRAIINTNALDDAISRTLDETANYYLLAWRPEGLNVAGGAPKFRKIEISIKGRPDLSVRVRRGFNNTAPERPTQTAAARPVAASPAVSSATNVALNGALNSLNPRRELPVDAYAVFTSDGQGGPVINASVQLTNDRLKFTPAGGKQQAQVEVAYVVLDEKGKAVRSDGRTLTVGGNDANGTQAGGSRGKIVTNFSIPVPAPGLYQFRTAARDAGSGQVGSAFEWIEVPDLKAKSLALSSLLITERRRANAAQANSAANQPPDILRVERRFARSSRIFLQLYIYNAARAADSPSADVYMEIKVLNAGRAVMNAPPHKVLPANEPERIFYAAEVPLANMPPGTYLLQVTATDRLKRTSATRELDFIVE
jgi:VWFA-related protein